MRSRRNVSNDWPVTLATSTPSRSLLMWYCQRSPGWYISGSVPRRRIHSSGSGIGSGRSGVSPRSKIAPMIGVPSAVISMPSPNVEVSRSRTVIGRRAGTVSSSGPSIRFSTRRSASSGSHGSTGSSSRSRHSSSRTIAAAIATGLDVEAIRKIVSRRIGAPPSWRIVPIASTCVSPPRLTRATSPGIFPDSTCRASTSRSLRSPASEKPLLPCPVSIVINFLLRWSDLNRPNSPTRRGAQTGLSRIDTTTLTAAIWS